MTGSDASSPLLSVRNLTVAFPTRDGEVRPVRGVSFDVHAGQRVALVGESGSGKSLTALSIMGLIRPPARVVEGTVELRGRDLVALDARAAAAVRGREVAMVYQDPLSALNPLQRVGPQIVEASRDVGRPAARARAIELLDEVGVPEPDRRFSSYPHQFSGGMLQRVVIAMALAGDPDLLIADEATTALDVVTQARIIDLLIRLSSDRQAALIMITHDLGVAAAVCETVYVAYAGRIVEQAPAIEFFERPVHPYSEALLGAMCALDGAPDQALPTIPGHPPRVGAFPDGCAFHPRCAYARPECRTVFPPTLEDVDLLAECHLAGERLERSRDGRPGHGSTKC